MKQSRRPKNRATPVEPGHWYGLTAPPPDRRPDSSQTDEAEHGHSRARDRIARRQSGARPDLGLRWIHVVIGLALAGIVGVIGLTIATASRGGGATIPTPTGAPANLATATLAPTTTISVQAWDGKARFTILVMGIDQRPGEPIGNSRTDVMLVLSLDPITRTGGMLSLPRDLFLPIPGESDMQRINAAFELGELKKPGGGPKLAMDTVQYNLGIRVDHYVIVNFAAVVAVVDAVGGVDIDVPAPIDDEQYPDMNYGYDPLHIPAGHIHMNGALALKFARTRHGDSDFERTHRQQQLILALREKVTRLNMLPDLLRQAPALWSQLQAGILTNLTLDQMLGLAVYAKDIPLTGIQHGTIEGQYARAIPWNGDTVVTTNRDALPDLMTHIFGASYAK